MNKGWQWLKSMMDLCLLFFWSFNIICIFCQQLKVLFSTFVNKNDEDYSLDIFEIVASTYESMKGIVNWKLLIFENIKWMHERHQMPFGVVEVTWIYIPNYWVIILTNIKDYWLFEWNWFFFPLLMYSRTWEDVVCNNFWKFDVRE